MLKMLRLVPFEQISGKHIEQIVASLNAAPVDIRIDGTALLRRLQSGHCGCYAWDNGLVVVGVAGNRLSLEAVSCGHLLKDAINLTSDLKEIAAERRCDTIETMVFDARLASVIEKLGGRVESITLTLAVE